MKSIKPLMFAVASCFVALVISPFAKAAAVADDGVEFAAKVDQIGDIASPDASIGILPYPYPTYPHYGNGLRCSCWQIEQYSRECSKTFSYIYDSYYYSPYQNYRERLIWLCVMDRCLGSYYPGPGYPYTDYPVPTLPVIIDPVLPVLLSEEAVR